MGSLKNLSGISSVNLVLSNSGKADIFIHDTLRAAYNVSIDSVIQVQSKQEFKNMLELVNIQPYMSDRWLFEIDYSKVKGSVQSHKGIFDSKTSCFTVNVSRYSDFKEFKELVGTCNDLYLPIVRKDDVYFLFKDCNLSDKLMQFVLKSYSRDSDKLFELRDLLLSGYEVETRRDIVKLIGVGSGSTLSFVFLLLAEPPKSARGYKTVLKKRIQMAVDLGNAYGVRSFRNYVASTVYDILQLKILYMQGIIYDSIRGLPEVFDEKKLSKYSYCLDRIKDDISYERVLRLYTILQSKENRVWYNDCDIANFIYNYYGGLVDETACEL